MLEVQKWLIEHNNLDLLNKQLGIKSNLHEDGRVILNYDQIESPKKSRIVRECRGLVLNSKDWSLVARSFYRFFNWEEAPDEHDLFDWNNCIAQHKEDGSLIIVYYWNDNWHVNTRGSFGNGNINDSSVTWRELFNMAYPNINSLDKRFTYVFELCSRYNKVVRDYPKPTIYILSMFDGEREIGIDRIEGESIARNIAMPKIKKFSNIKEVELYVKELSKNDSTFEGIVLRDKHGHRFKLKSAEYVALHRLSNNGNIASDKNLIPFILKNEVDEILSYFPELTQRVYYLSEKIEGMLDEMDKMWFVHGDEPSQKKFAMLVKDKPYSGFLFEARKTGQSPEEIFRNSPERVLKIL